MHHLLHGAIAIGFLVLLLPHGPRQTPAELARRDVQMLDHDFTADFAAHLKAERADIAAATRRSPPAIPASALALMHHALYAHAEIIDPARAAVHR
jgi:hypothetical protein